MGCLLVYNTTVAGGGGGGASGGKNSKHNATAASYRSGGGGACASAVDNAFYLHSENPNYYPNITNGGAVNMAKCNLYYTITNSRKCERDCKRLMSGEGAKAPEDYHLGEILQFTWSWRQF